MGGERPASPEPTVQRLLIGSGRWWGLGDYVGLAYGWCTEKFAEGVVSDRMKVVPWALEDWKRYRLGGLRGGMMTRVRLAAQRGGAPGAGREARPFPAPGGVLGKQWALFWQREEVRVTLALTHWDPEPTLLGLLWAQPGGVWGNSPPRGLRCRPPCQEPATPSVQIVPSLWGFPSLCPRSPQTAPELWICGACPLAPTSFSSHPLSTAVCI